MSESPKRFMDANRRWHLMTITVFSALLVVVLVQFAVVMSLHSKLRDTERIAKQAVEAARLAQKTAEANQSELARQKVLVVPTEFVPEGDNRFLFPSDQMYRRFDSEAQLREALQIE